jgi:peptidyl-prolyl cis-trans isomerase D
MIDTFKKFTKKKIAGLLLIIVIIVAFGFGGFGGGFNPGNQNNIAKINNTNISTQDFMDYLNQSGFSQQILKENIDKNIIEELLSALVSTTLLDLEIKDLGLILSEETLRENLKNNKNFHDEDDKFKRTIYEKFLLSQKMSAPMYELKLKNNILQKQLFTFISGGAKSPKFLVNKFYVEQNSKLEVDYIALNKFYKKREEFTDQEIQLFINQNTKELKQEYIDFSYAIINPKNITGLEEFNQTFFDKIDDIENKIAKNIDFRTIVNELNIVPIVKKNYINQENNETIENKIYNYRKNQIDILEDNGTYIFYQIDNVITKLPNFNDNKFKVQIKELLFQKEKFEFNKKILDQITEKKFDQITFEKLGNNDIKKIQLNSNKDKKKFEINSVEILYSLPINSFTLVADNNDDVFVAKIVGLEKKNITDTSKEFNAISNAASAKNRNSILRSYDYHLNSKYKVVVNEKTLNRVKNYFR